MNDNSNNIRFILSIVLMLLIWVVWKAIFPDPMPQMVTADAATEADSASIASANTDLPPPPTARLDALSDSSSDAGTDKITLPAAPKVEEFYQFSVGASDVMLSSKHATITKWELKNFALRDDDDKNDDNQTEKRHVSMLATEQLRLNLGNNIAMPEYYQLVKQSADEIILRGQSQQLQVEYKYNHHDDYIMDVDVTISNIDNRKLTLAPQVAVQGLESKDEGSFFAPSYDVLKLKCLVNNDLEDALPQKVKKAGEEFSGNVSWVGADRQYFLAAVGPRPGNAASTKNTCRFNPKADNSAAFAEATLLMAAVDLQPGNSTTISYRAFIGPKMQKSFDIAAMELDEAVDYVLWGIPLAFLAKPMLWLLALFFNWTKSYGLAIILLTMVVKLLLLPINHKNLISMRNMQKLQPLMEEVKKRYPNDQEAQSRELMKIYQQEHINPLTTGCLPMFLQMPILCALYRAIGAAVELYQQPFLWISDLSSKEAFPFLAIAMGLIMILQQKLSSASNKSSAMNNSQMKMMMYGMPIFMTFIMMALPSGLVLYTLVNCILSIFHQLYINKKYKAA